MKYMFDSSAIFEAIKENKIGVLVGNYTVELVRYEIGNILWKNYVLQTKITKQELASLTKVVKETLNVMETIQIVCNEEEILEVAAKFKITFYDASFAYYASAKDLTLVTEDTELLKKVAPEIKVLQLRDIIKIKSTR
jgi:predicted nucleic acid-binding protein